MLIEDVCKSFLLDGEIEEIENIASGLINKSYIIRTNKNTYVIQKINNYVFKNPKLIMDNIEIVTNFLKNKNNLEFETLELINTIEGNNCLVNDKEYYRCYLFIKNGVTIDRISNSKEIKEIGKCLGAFQNELCDLDANILNITISNFHNTVKRFNDLKDAFINSNISKQKDAISLYLEIIKYEEFYSILIDKINKNEIPIRVVHNDTKSNNFIFDKESMFAKCIIDYDTIMPGSWLFDIGDVIRSCCASLKEDDVDFDNVYIVNDYFISFLIGYIPYIKDVITVNEKELIVDSIFIITMEIAMRFLTDYLNGNKYFKVCFYEHNLVRAKNQVMLAKYIKNNELKLKNIVNKVFLHFENTII